MNDSRFLRPTAKRLADQRGVPAPQRAFLDNALSVLRRHPALVGIAAGGSRRCSDRFQAAIGPDARLFFVDRNGHLGQLTQAAWYEGFAANAGKEEPGELRIASVEVTRDIASVRVVEDYPQSRYIDYLALVKFDGAWRIVNKVYTAEHR